MACFTEWGGMNEIQAMSLLFKREFIIFNGQMQIHRPVTNNGFKDTIYLCYSPQKQYDTIYTREVVATAAYCQCRKSIMFIYFYILKQYGNCINVILYNLICSYSLSNTL